MNVVRFYRSEDLYGEFSNFAAFPISIEGRFWPTTEHYFQAQKFVEASHQEAIRLAASPRIAAQMGRDQGKPLRSDWELIKETIMLTALRAKFSQHPMLATLLLGTGDLPIVEHTTKDSYWGDGGDGTGENQLGELLSQVRAQLRSEQISVAQIQPASNTDGTA